MKISSHVETTHGIRIVNISTTTPLDRVIEKKKQFLMPLLDQLLCHLARVQLPIGLVTLTAICVHYGVQWDGLSISDFLT